MTIFLIISTCFLILVALMGFVVLFNRKKFITFSIEKDFKSQFKRCFCTPYILSIIECSFSFISFILIWCDCGFNGKLNETSEIWGPCLLGGAVIGFVIGLIYWKKIKEPFFIKNFKDEFDKYTKEVQDMWVQIRVSYHEMATIENFLCPLYSLGSLLGIILSYLL